MNNGPIALKFCTGVQSQSKNAYMGEYDTYGKIRAIKGKYAQIRVIKPKYSQIYVNSGKYR